MLLNSQWIFRSPSAMSPRPERYDRPPIDPRRHKPPVRSREEFRGLGAFGVHGSVLIKQHCLRKQPPRFCSLYVLTKEGVNGLGQSTKAGAYAFSLGHRWPLGERVSVRIDGANFRVTGFEWSMRIVAIDTSNEKKVKAPRVERSFSFARDWRNLAHLSLRHVSAIAAVRTSFPFAADRVDQTLGTRPFG